MWVNQGTETDLKAENAGNETLAFTEEHHLPEMGKKEISTPKQENPTFSLNCNKEKGKELQYLTSYLLGSFCAGVLLQLCGKNAYLEKLAEASVLGGKPPLYEALLAFVSAAVLLGLFLVPLWLHCVRCFYSGIFLLKGIGDGVFYAAFWTQKGRVPFAKFLLCRQAYQVFLVLCMIGFAAFVHRQVQEDNGNFLPVKDAYQRRKIVFVFLALCCVLTAAAMINSRIAALAGQLYPLVSSTVSKLASKAGVLFSAAGPGSSGGI